MKAYEVQKLTYDASRPYAVVATFRSFNRVIDRYSDESKAHRRARDLNRVTTILVSPVDTLVTQTLGVLCARETVSPDYAAIVAAVRKAAQATEVTSVFLVNSAINVLAHRYSVRPQ